MLSLLDTAIRRGFTPGTCTMDKGYDGSGIYTGCESRDIPPVIPLKLTVNVARGKHEPPWCSASFACSFAEPYPASAGASPRISWRMLSPADQPTGCT